MEPYLDAFKETLEATAEEEARADREADTDLNSSTLALSSPILEDTDQLGEAGGDELWLELCPLLVAQACGQGVLQTQLLSMGV